MKVKREEVELENALAQRDKQVIANATHRLQETNTGLLEEFKGLVSERDRLKEENRQLKIMCQDMITLSEKAKGGKGYDGEPDIWPKHILILRRMKTAIALTERYFDRKDKKL